jgi:hypothetical protein
MSDELVKQESNLPATTRPAYLDKYKGDVRGTDHFTKDDLRLPRLTIAQKTSPQVEEGTPEYIEGLKFGDLFNDLSNDVYGRGPLRFVIVRADRPRAMEFNPIDEGGGVVDFDVPLTDPRCAWTTNPETGKREKPVATVFYDYVLWLVDHEEMAALSLKSTGLKVAKRLNSMIKLRGMPLFTGLYEVTTEIQKNDFGSFGVYVIKNAGWASEELAANAEGIYESIKDKTLNIDREADDETPSSGGGSGTQEDVPF